MGASCSQMRVPVYLRFVHHSCETMVLEGSVALRMEDKSSNTWTLQGSDPGSTKETPHTPRDLTIISQQCYVDRKIEGRLWEEFRIPNQQFQSNIPSYSITLLFHEQMRGKKSTIFILACTSNLQYINCNGKAITLAITAVPCYQQGVPSGTKVYRYSSPVYTIV